MSSTAPTPPFHPLLLNFVYTPKLARKERTNRWQFILSSPTNGCSSEDLSSSWNGWTSSPYSRCSSTFFFFAVIHKHPPTRNPSLSSWCLGLQLSVCCGWCWLVGWPHPPNKLKSNSHREQLFARGAIYLRFLKQSRRCTLATHTTLII